MIQIKETNLTLVLLFLALSYLSASSKDKEIVDSYSKDYCYVTFFFEELFEDDMVSLSFGDTFKFDSKLMSPRDISIAAKLVIFVKKNNKAVKLKVSLPKHNQEKIFDFDYTKGTYIMISTLENNELYIKQSIKSPVYQ